MNVLSIAAGVAGVVLALVTLILVIRQVGIMKQQTTIFERQLKIMAQQDEIFAMERRQRADLVLEAHVKDAESGIAFVELRALNRGNKTAKDFYWHVSIPTGIVAGPVLRGNDSGIPWERIMIGESPHDHYSDVRREPLYPKRQTTLVRFKAKRAKASVEIAWQMTTEDGMFPTDEKPGVATVHL